MLQQTGNKKKLPPPKQFNEELIACWQALQGNTTISVYRCLIDITGAIKPAVMLSQLIYWTRVGTEIIENRGWIYKSITQLEEETGLSKAEQRRCKEKFYELGLLMQDRVGMGARLAFKVDFDALTDAVCRLHDLDNPEDGIDIETLRDNSSLFYRRYFSDRISYHRDLVSLTGDIHAAIMLSHAMKQSLYDNRHWQSDDQHAFASLTIPDWQKSICLSYKSQRTARDKLKRLGFIWERNFYASRRIFTLVDGKRILKAIQAKIKGKSSLAEKAFPVCAKGHNPEETEAYTDDFTDLPYFAPPRASLYKRAIPEVLKGQIKKCEKEKFTSAKSGNSEVSKGQIIYINNYNNKTTTTTEKIADEKTNAIAPQENVVAASADYSALHWSHCFSEPEIRQQAQQMFKQLLPQASTERLQEILDEITGQTKPIGNPLGFLMHLVKAAANNTLLCTQAAIVKRNREFTRSLQQHQHRPEKTEPAAEQPKPSEHVDGIRQQILSRLSIRKGF